MTINTEGSDYLVPQTEPKNQKILLIIGLLIITLLTGLAAGIYITNTLLVPETQNELVITNFDTIATSTVPDTTPVKSEKLLYIIQTGQTSVGEMNYDNNLLKTINIDGSNEETLFTATNTKYFKFIPEINTVFMFNQLTGELWQYELTSEKTTKIFSYQQFNGEKQTNESISADSIILSPDKQKIALSLSIYGGKIISLIGKIYTINLNDGLTNNIYNHDYAGAGLFGWEKSGKMYFQELAPKDCSDNVVEITPNKDKYKLTNRTSSKNLGNEISRLLNKTTSPDDKYYYTVTSHPNTQPRGLDMCDDGLGSGIMRLYDMNNTLLQTIENDSINDFIPIGWTDDSKFIKYYRFSSRSSYPNTTWTYFAYNIITGERLEFQTKEKLELWDKTNYPNHNQIEISTNDEDIVNIMINGDSIKSYPNSKTGSQVVQILGTYTP